MKHPIVVKLKAKQIKKNTWLFQENQNKIKTWSTQLNYKVQGKCKMSKPRMASSS